MNYPPYLNPYAEEQEHETGFAAKVATMCTRMPLPILWLLNVFALLAGLVFFGTLAALWYPLWYLYFRLGRK